MIWLGAAIGCWLVGAVAVWLLRSRERAGIALATFTTALGASCLILAAARVFTGGSQAWQAQWNVPFGPIAVLLDPLAAVFLLPIALIGTMCVLYAPAYARLRHAEAPIAAQLAGCELLLASMVLIVIAANTVLLLAAWELMTLASWRLLTVNHRDAAVRGAGLQYLIAGQVSAAALALLVVLLAQDLGSWRIPAGTLATGPGSLSRDLLLALALVSFGTKAGIAPLHVWLPDAHAAAPSHVSALMSGVLITLGIYGLIRFVPAFGPVPPAWAIAILGLGALGACGGIAMAVSQSDVKRILAYSTVENAGLMALGIGAALLATTMGQPALAALAWSAVLLHVWNHAIAKALLFLTAGAMAELVRSRDLERWGGLLRRLPILGTTLMIGCAALVGLPGTHTFASEWLLLVALFRDGQVLAGPQRLAVLVAVVAVAFAAGTALACFTRLVGVGMLGHPRSGEAEACIAPRRLGLAFPAVVLAGLCLLLVAFIRPMLGLISRAVDELVPGGFTAETERLASPLGWLVLVPIAMGASVAAYRAWVGRSRVARSSVTWDCGYARPRPSMQYSASSLAQPVTRVLQPALRTMVDWTPPRGLWPAPMRWEARTPERALAELYRPGYLRVTKLLGSLSRLQEGRVMVYLRYVGLALLVLLAWFFWPTETPR